MRHLLRRLACLLVDHDWRYVTTGAVPVDVVFQCDRCRLMTEKVT